MQRCSAPWYEMNITCADNYVSSCCYYAGPVDTWKDDAGSIEDYWNSENMQLIRSVQNTPEKHENNGCSNCFFFNRFNTSDAAQYYDFSELPPGLSIEQEENWLEAQKSYNEQEEVVNFSPIRIYANFGYTCNLSCGMCHQVPRRQTWDRRIDCDTIYAWKDAMKRALQVNVIGGEPFAMPESLKFIRKFAADEDMKHTQLAITTNATVLHKHLEMLKQKDRIAYGISIDSIGKGYEKVRAGGKWDVVANNILAVKELMDTTHPEWIMSTSSALSKTSLEHVIEFAEWHAENGIPTFLYDFINYRGTEDFFYRENIVENTTLLDDVPGWREKLQEACTIFEQAGMSGAVESIETQVKFIDKNLAEREKKHAFLPKNNHNIIYDEQLKYSNKSEMESLFKYKVSKQNTMPYLDDESYPLTFIQFKEGDRLVSPWMDVEDYSVIKIEAEWAELLDPMHRHTHILIEFGESARGVPVRKWTKNDDKEQLTMHCATNGYKSMRVSILPTGEYISKAPISMSVGFY